MLRSRIAVVAVAVLAGLTACDRRAGDGETVRRDTIISTVPRQDTVAVERTITEDTIRRP